MDFLGIIASPTVDQWTGTVLLLAAVFLVIVLVVTAASMAGARANLGNIGLVFFILIFLGLFALLFTYVGVDAADRERYNHAVALKAAAALDAELLDWERTGSLIEAEAITEDDEYLDLRLLSEGSKWYILALE